MREIIDPHQHLWQLDRFRYPWLTEPPLIDLVTTHPELASDYLLEDYLADTKGLQVVKTVHVEANPAVEHRIAETAWLQVLADQPENRGLPTGIVASSDLFADDFTAKLEEQLRFSRLRGLRQNLNGYAAAPFEDNSWRRNFASIAAHGLSFDLHILPSQMADAARLAGDIPDVAIALNHSGLPDMATPEGFTAWRTGMAALAPFPQISVKLSGFGMLAPQVTAEAIRPYLLEAISLFGPERCMFASNFPVDRPFIKFSELWGLYEQVVSDFTEPEQKQLFHDSAEAFYRL